MEEEKTGRDETGQHGTSMDRTERDGTGYGTTKCDAIGRKRMGRGLTELDLIRRNGTRHYKAKRAGRCRTRCCGMRQDRTERYQRTDGNSRAKPGSKASIII